MLQTDIWNSQTIRIFQCRSDKQQQQKINKLNQKNALCIVEQTNDTNQPNAAQMPTKEKRQGSWSWSHIVEQPESLKVLQVAIIFI